MGDSKVIRWLPLLALLGCLGCGAVQYNVAKQLRRPGERLLDFPEAVAEEYSCETRERPFFEVERNELVPDQVKPGGGFAHRMVYVMCPPGPTEVVSGQLSTRIRFKGRPIVKQTEDRYEIKPGRWVVDTLVELPEAAEPGVYAYELDFEGDELRFERGVTFVVRGH